MNGKRKVRFTVAALLALACLVPFAFSGCGKCRDELDQAKREVEGLTSANKQLTETVSTLETEKSGLDQEVKRLREKNESLDKDLDNLKKAHAQIVKEKAHFEDRSKAMQQEVLSLKKANDDLQKQAAQLKDESTPSTGLMKDQATAPRESQLKPDIAQLEKRAEMDPCDALVEYMQKVGAMIRVATKEERSQRLEQIKKEYGGRMEKAPKEAKAAAESWVTELVQGWDKPGDDIVFNLIRKRDNALKACKKDPDEAGF
jgi:septal ring factor EnvC (AmiA/AmiB activator)